MKESEYTPLWEALKASTKSPKQVSVAANRLLHPRIVKAIAKRKWLDVGYKLQIEPEKAILYFAQDGSKLTLILEQLKGTFADREKEEKKKQRESLINNL